MANSATGSAPDRVAVLDLGSNTVLLLVLARDGRVLRDEAEITRLGQGVFASGVLAADARARTTRAACAFAERARSAGAERVVAVGTEALRRARDGRAWLDELAAAAGLDDARILSGEQEAAFTLEASRGAAGPDALLVIDVGGGSTELAWSGSGGAVHGVSLPLGTVRLTEALVSRHPLPASELAGLRRAARDGLREVAVGGEQRVVAVAGTATTLAALELVLDVYDPERVEGHEISRERLGVWIDRLAALDLPARAALPGLEPGRADVIVAGLVILDAVLERARAAHFRVSGSGVRHGVALALLAGRYAG